MSIGYVAQRLGLCMRQPLGYAARSSVRLPAPKSIATGLFRGKAPYIHHNAGGRTFSASASAPSPNRSPFWLVAAGIAGAAATVYFATRKPPISLEELEEHRTVEKGLWIAWKDPQDQQWKVSAMADFVKEHPGGEMIVEAGGKAAMPFWQRFARHLDPSGVPTPLVLAELRARIVGILKEPPPEAEIADPYHLEPHRPESTLTLLQKQPYCAGQKPANLTSFITEDIFIRSNGPAPLLEDYSLTIETPAGSSVFTLETLKELPSVDSVSILECTGDRRSEIPGANGLPWESAVANVKVAGYRFWDVLEKLGVQPQEGLYVVVEQLDKKGMRQFSTCLPLNEVPEDTLLATTVNGESSRDHTGSVRFWPFGLYGNFFVKNPTRIRIVSADAAPLEKVAQYAGLGTAWSHAVALSDNLGPYVKRHQNGTMSLNPKQRVNAIAFAKREGIAVAQGATDVAVEGRAWSGGGRHIASVKISADQGKTWEEAALDPTIQQPPGKRYAWTGWKIQVRMAEHTTHLLVRATDSEGNVQPEAFDPDPRGLGNNRQLKIPIHRVS